MIQGNSLSLWLLLNLTNNIASGIPCICGHTEVLHVYIGCMPVSSSSSISILLKLSSSLIATMFYTTTIHVHNGMELSRLEDSRRCGSDQLWRHNYKGGVFAIVSLWRIIITGHSLPLYTSPLGVQLGVPEYTNILHDLFWWRLTECIEGSPPRTAGLRLRLRKIKWAHLAALILIWWDCKNYEHM